MKRTKTKFLKSVIALLACFAMLVGSTFAWFTDSVSSMNNIITSGNLDLEMYWTDDLSGTWYNVEDPAYNTIFNYDNWEPGYTEVRYIKLVNVGELALNYQLAVAPQGSVGKLAEVINVYFANEGVVLNDRADLSNLYPVGLLSNVMNGAATADGTLLAADQSSPLHPSGEIVMTVAMSMLTTAGNDYQSETVGDGFTITAVATQCAFEEDSFGSDYDAGATFPAVLQGASVSAPVTPVDGKVPAGGVTLAGSGVSAILPEGVKLADGADKVTLKVTPLESSSTDITVVNQEILIPMDVHIEGVAEDNTVPIVIDLGEILPKHLNIGNYTLIHVEDGVNNPMTRVADAAALTAHNQFVYHSDTGEVTVSMASFSEVAAIADIANEWGGNYADADTTFAGSGTQADPYIISKADELAGLGELVSAGEAFAGKYFKLISNIVIGTDNTWYPIGYHKPGDGTNAAGETWYQFGGGFSGVFDGNGHTIADIYQNTWGMDGDYDYGYWDDAMGVFGRIYGGTIKNLTVDNFTSDGEFTPTGVIAAFADSTSTGAVFENIAITHCNPRVYNIGNGGIVGIGGWYYRNNAESNGKPIVFRNITVDNTNKISALWGSWDVSCGGIMGQYYGNSESISMGVDFENCHMAAQIDVNNDVCANYQYYWYRYSGMMIGSIRKNVEKDGYSIPDMTGITATGCTVHYGDWNDYYYCELVANSLASYTHEHQFSRLEKIASESDIKDADGNWAKTGNFYHVASNTCYHIMKNKAGELYRHYHDVADESNPNIYETKDIDGDGELNDLKEDNERIYLPFDQLFTGYGWGVKSQGLKDVQDLGLDIEILDVQNAGSVTKFNKADSAKDSYITGTTVAIGDLFTAATGVDAKLAIKADKVQVTVSPVGADSTVSATLTDKGAWNADTLTFNGVGAAAITITDYYFCKATTLIVTIDDLTAVDKFAKKFTSDAFTYRVGNVGEVALGTLFADANAGVAIKSADVSVSITPQDGSAASGTYTANSSNWTQGKIKFNGLGMVTVTITDNYYCNTTTQELLVVAATNATGAANATDTNVVLLGNSSFNTLTVSGGHSFYGNGFTLTRGSDSAVLDFGYSFVTLNNGTLDNVQIVCPNFDYAALYKKQLTSSDNRSQTTDKTRYYNAQSGVMVSGNSSILNSRISGGRAAVYVTGGNVEIENSRIERGAAASVLINPAVSGVVFRDVELFQEPTPSTYDSSKSLMGFSVLFMCDSAGKSAPLTLEGTLVQCAWAGADEKQYVPSEGTGIIDAVLAKTNYVHTINGKDAVNLGFAYLPDEAASISQPNNITDNRSNSASVPYAYEQVKATVPTDLLPLEVTVYVYAYKNTNGTAESFKALPAYAPEKYNDIITLDYADVNANRVFDSDFVAGKGTVYSLTVDLDQGAYTFDFSKLILRNNGMALSYQVNGAAPGTVAVQAGTTSYTLTASDGSVVYFNLVGKETSKDAPQWSSDANGTALSTSMNASWEAGICVATSKGGTWHGAAPALQNVYVRYYSTQAKAYKIIHLADYTPSGTGTFDGTDTSCTITGPDFTLTLTGGQVHSSNNVYAMPVVTNGKLYFLPASSKGLVNSGNGARTVPVSYSFTDGYNNTLTGSHTWSIAEDKNNEYKYSSFCSGTLEGPMSSSIGCFAEGTMITLADGTQKPIEQITYEDQLIAWDFNTGAYAVTTPSLIETHETSVNRVINLQFADGTVARIIGDHGFFDVAENNFVFLDEANIDAYVGHDFLKVSADGAYEPVKLLGYEVTVETVSYYTIQTAIYNNCIAQGMFTLTSPPEGVDGWFDYFEIGDDMKYDRAAMQADIEKYGLYAYEDFAEYVTYDQFLAFNGPYLKVLVGRGVLTYEDILTLIGTYVNP